MCFHLTRLGSFYIQVNINEVIPQYGLATELLPPLLHFYTMVLSVTSFGSFPSSYFTITLPLFLGI